MKLKNDPLDYHPEVQGTYKLSAININGHPSWTSSTHAIWYILTSKQWVVGSLQSIGTNEGKFSGRQQDDNNFAMPCEQNCWAYLNIRSMDFDKPKGYGLFHNANDVNIQCTGNRGVILGKRLKPKSSKFFN